MTNSASPSPVDQVIFVVFCVGDMKSSISGFNRSEYNLTLFDISVYAFSLSSRQFLGNYLCTHILFGEVEGKILHI